MMPVRRRKTDQDPSRAVIWWLRRDLRLMDQAVLNAALQAADVVIPLFIFDPAILNSRNVGEKRLTFLMNNLHALNRSLRQKGNSLVIRSGNPEQVLSLLISEIGARTIYAEGDGSPYALKRDQQVAKALPLRIIGSVALHPPGSVLKSDGTPYTIFTPFNRAWKALPKPNRFDLLAIPDRIPGLGSVKSEPIPEMQALATEIAFPAGEAEAAHRLSNFLKDDNSSMIYEYGEQRNRMDREGTAQISPYLRFGVLSSRQVVVAALEAVRDAPEKTARVSAETWLNELIWREFYLHIQYHFPFTRRHAFKKPFRKIDWQNDLQDFDAWCNGKTGYPVVDAGMRQLSETGWMHNRARMITASFLTKDLLIDWRWGERWFMQNLVDGDPAANNGGWQWCAGTGTDAAPYFRIFNPVIQARKFDPSGDYIRRWVPELSFVPRKFIHEPWQMPPDVQSAAGCQIGKDYPYPILDHAFARQRAIKVFGASRI